jgi:DNA-binding transcriptional LysR family regulator
MRQLNLDQVKALIEVIECGSFTAAAARLNLTQPAVSLQIQELESRFQVGLIERVGRHIRPTPAGLELARIGRRLIAEAEEAHLVMRRYSAGFLGQVRLGTTMTALIYVMPPVIRDLKVTAPLIELRIRTDFSGGTLQAVYDNELDLGLCVGPVNNRHVEAILLNREPLVAIFASDWPGVPDVVEPAMLSRWPLILGNPKSALRALTESWIRTAGPPPRPVMELDNVAGIKSVVGAGLGVSIIPAILIDEHARDRQVTARPLSPPIDRELYLVMRRDKADDPVIRLVRDAILRHLGRQPVARSRPG